MVLATGHSLHGPTAGDVELANGQFLHQIELIPAPAHYDFTLTENKIVMAAIVFLQREGLLEHQCYRSVDEKLLPGVKVLDYAQVAKIGLHPVPKTPS
jgi:hypothetical protein